MGGEGRVGHHSGIWKFSACQVGVESWREQRPGEFGREFAKKKVTVVCLGLFPAPVILSPPTTWSPPTTFFVGGPGYFPFQSRKNHDSSPTQRTNPFEEESSADVASYAASWQFPIHSATAWQ